MSEIKTIQIREAILPDLPSIVDIYNTIINEGGFTADLKPYTIESRREWFLSLTKNHNIFVLAGQKEIIGYFYFSPWREGREALSSTAEVSFYIDKNDRGKGLGNLILTEVLNFADKRGLKNLLAILLDTNKASIALLKKYGFEIAGHLPDIAILKNRSCGQYLMLKDLSK